MSVIKIKRGTTDPTASNVTNAGELAANTSTPKVFLKTADDSVTTPIWVGAQIEATPGDWTSATKLATQSGINTTFMPKAGGTFTGITSFSQGSTAAGEIRLLEDTDDGSNYSAFRGSARAANITYVLPTTDPTAGQVLSSSAPSSNVATLSWADASSATTVTTSNDNTNTNRFLVFVSGSGASSTLYVDETTGPLYYNPSLGLLTLAGDLAVNGGDITTTSTTATVFNATATTLNMGSAATTVSIGATTGTFAIRNPAVLIGSNVGGTNGTISVNDAKLIFTTANYSGASIAGNTYPKISLDEVNGSGSFVNIEGADLRLGRKILDGSTNVAVNLVFEGATDDGFETTLTAGDPGADYTVTLPSATDTLVGRATTDTLTNKTLTTPKIAQINDTAGLAVLKTAATASAVNELTITNAAATTAPHISATGTDTNISLHLTPKGSGSVVIQNGPDGTKQIAVGVAGAATGTTTFLNAAQTVNRTITLPDATDTLVGRATTDTLTNKTLTSPTLTTPVLGTPSSGTLTSCTGLPISGLTASTSTALGVGSIELGHATDTTIARVSAGVVSIEGIRIVTVSATETLTNKTLTSPTLTTPVLGTPSSGTLTSCTGLPISGLVASTSDALGIGTIELGHASDTTIARSGAGAVTIEGVRIVTETASQTLTNKTLTSPIVTTGLTTGSASFDLLDTTATTVNFAGAATTANIGYDSTGTSTTNISTGVAASTFTKTVNIGTGSAAGSATNVTIGSSSGTSTVTINGNLTVAGTTTTVNTTNLDVQDKNITLGKGNTSDAGADTAGITADATSPKTLQYDNTNTAWTSSENMNVATGKAYKVAGTNVLTATALGSGVVGSSLTSVGTIGTGIWQGTVVGLTYGGTGRALTAAAGGIVWSDADSLEITTAGTSGYVLTSGGTSTPTWTNATDANTASAIVKRDASGNFTAGTMSGTASNASAVTMASSTDTTSYLAFVSDASATSQGLKYNSSLLYNATTNYLDANIDGGTY